LSNETELYRVSTKVVPAAWHPKFYDWEHGFLSLWFFAGSLNDASYKAETIIAVLPYERVGDEFAIESGFPQTEESLAMHGRAQEQAQQTGLAIRLFAVATGCGNEKKFESAPL
jgi:hypothetical protein